MLHSSFVPFSTRASLYYFLYILPFTLFFSPLSLILPSLLSLLFPKLYSHVLLWFADCSVLLIFMKNWSHILPLIQIWVRGRPLHLVVSQNYKPPLLVIGGDEKKTVTSILTQAFWNNSAVLSIQPPSAWQSRNNTNRRDFQMQNGGKSVVSSHFVPFSHWYKKKKWGKEKLWIIKFTFVVTVYFPK